MFTKHVFYYKISLGINKLLLGYGEGIIIETIASLISEIGFPIVITLILLYMLNTNETRYDETIASLRKTVDENTKALTALCHALGYDYKHLEDNDNEEE